MAGAAAYGALLGVVVATAQGFDSPAIWALVWLVIAVQLAACTVIVWRRTAMALMTASMAYGALVSLGFAALGAAGVGYAEVARTHPLEIVATLAVSPFLLVQQYRADPERWSRWCSHAEQCSLGDYLMLRHIPDLRGTQPSTSLGAP